MPGGYVGVDVFFVISGFLITSHLLGEVAQTGTVSLTTFWARRIRRLLPAAFAVLGTSLVAAYIFLPKSLLQQTLKEIGASALYVQNWVLAGSSVDYLGVDNKPTLAQHFWSLSVEEQFYVVWPVLILLAVWVASKTRRSEDNNRRAIGLALLTVFVASLTYSIYETAQSQPSAYFVTPTRAWEFTAGALLAVLPAWSLRQRAPRLDSLYRLTASWGGLALIVYSAFRFDGESQFPGYIALLPVVGSVLIIHAGQHEQRWMPGRLAAHRPVQLVGDVSYALYLWHWPLIVLFPFVMGSELTVWGKLGVLMASLALALATKYWIEDPVQRAAILTRRRAPSYAFMAAGMITVTAVSLMISLQLAANDRARADDLAEASECLGAQAMHAPTACADPFAVVETVDPGFAANDKYWGAGSALAGGVCLPAADAILATCEFGVLDDPTRTVAFLGDSHGEHMVEPLALASEAENWKLVPHVRARCSGLLSKEEIALRSEDTSIAADQAECYTWGRAVIDSLVARTDIDAVIISASGVSVNPESSAQINRLAESGKSVVLLGDSPDLPGDLTAAECVEASDVSDDPCSWLPGPENDVNAANAITFGIPYVDISPNFCSADGRCHVVIGGLITYFDDNHLTLSFSRTLAPFLAERLGATLDAYESPSGAS